MKITCSGRNVGRRTVAAETGPGCVPGVRDGTGGVVPRETTGPRAPRIRRGPVAGPPPAWGTLSAMTQPDDAPDDAPAPPRRPTRASGARPPLPRTGIGVDVHAFAAEPGAPLHLACLTWPGEPGLEGHSDGDVVAHACCDALFSAAGLGDLGSNFGTAEPRWRGASGAVLLAEAARRVRAAGYEIGNVAVQLVGARPRVSARAVEARAALSAAAGADVSFSATTTDHLGFLGREEGLLAVATALVHPVGQ